MFVRFLVGVLAISAQRGRYHRFNTGTIASGPWGEALGPWDERKSIDKPRCGISRTPAGLDSTIATIWAQSNGSHGKQGVSRSSAFFMQDKDVHRGVCR